MSTIRPARGFTTAILHSDRDAPVEHGALHKPLHVSVAYGYRDARELAAVFQGRAQGYVYGRQGNPTTGALEAKVTAMEGGIATIAFATGMAAIGAAMLALLREGDHVVASQFLFGNTVSLFGTLAGRGTPITFVDATDWACPTDPCPTVVGRYLVYRDRHHLATRYVIALGERLLAALPSVDVR